MLFEFTNFHLPCKNNIFSKILLISNFFYLDGDAYVDMDSVLSNNPAPDINASKPEALEILKLILGNNSMMIFDTQKNVDSTDGKIVILKLC